MNRLYLAWIIALLAAGVIGEGSDGEKDVKKRDVGSDRERRDATVLTEEEQVALDLHNELRAAERAASMKRMVSGEE